MTPCRISGPAAVLGKAKVQLNNLAPRFSCVILNSKLWCAQQAFGILARVEVRTNMTAQLKNNFFNNTWTVVGTNKLIDHTMHTEMGTKRKLVDCGPPLHTMLTEVSANS